jgi:aminoglycoside phosphotransferase (APT) family kinase protein
VILSTILGERKVVVRRYHDAARLSADFAYDPVNEAAALRLTVSHGVPSPSLLAENLDGSVSGSPLLLVSFVPGSAAWRWADDPAYLEAAARALVAIHAIGGSAPVKPYRPYHEGRRVVPSISARPHVWEQAFEALDRPPPAGVDTFIHRDYHPGNALWDGSSLHVVDWPTAGVGPAGIDLARMRQNLAAWRGPELADRFAQAYVAAGGSPDARHPYWDLSDACELIDDDPSAPGEGDWERFEDYVARVASEM